MNSPVSRREMLGMLAGAVPFLAAAPSLFSAESGGRKRLGVGMHSYGIHWKAGREGHPQARFKDALSFLEYCHSLGAGGIQVAIGPRDVNSVAKLRAQAEAWQMYFEGQVSLPKDETDLIRFDVDLRAVKEAGATVVRTAMLGGRRYETFETADAFRQFAEKSWKSLTLAEPVVRKHRLKLAIENHKDWRVPEFLDLLERINSEHVGVCVDTGNNLALLEEPMAVVEALAPFAFSSHLKDMAVQEYGDGFLLSEVPLGEGFLDLKRMIELLLKANPRIQFSLEMITRDPLKIPCLTKKYWATMGTVPARDLAAALTMVRRNTSKKPLPRTTGLDADQQLALEDEHVRKSFVFAREHLGL